MLGKSINTLAEYINQLPDISPIKQEYYALIMQRQALHNGIAHALQELSGGRTLRAVDILQLTQKHHASKTNTQQG